MCDVAKTRAQLVEELSMLRQRVAELEASEARRKHAEAALRDSEDRHRALVEQSLVGIYIVQEGRFRYVNPKFAEIFGYTPEEIVETLRSGNELVSEKDRARVRAKIQRRLRGKVKTLHYTFQGCRKDGTLIDVEIYGNTMALHGKPAVIGTLLDITDRKRAERAVQNSEERYRALVEGSIQGISISRNGIHLFANKALATMLGYQDPAELLQKSIWEHVAPHDIERLRSYFEARLRGEPAPARYEYQAHKTDGTLMWIERQVSPIMWDDELAYLGTYFDITERKGAEAALRVSETQLRTITETVETALFIYQGTQMCYVNAAAESLSGYTRNELLGMQFWEILHPDFQELVKKRGLGRQQGRQVPSCYEVKILTKDRRERWIDYTAGIIEFKGAPAVLGTAVDITERKRTEQRLHRSQVQLRALASRYLAAQEEERQRIARELHDILGQNLTALKLDLLWVDRRLTADQSPVRQKIAQMSVLAEHMVDTVGEIMTALRPAILDHLGLAAAIEWQVDVFRERTGIAVTVACDEDAARELASEQSLALFRVLQEIFTNVARHADATMVSVHLSAVAGAIHLEVRDNGCGIPDDAVGSPRSLGLLGMRERVLPWNGEVHIQGYPGQGTVVNLRLPLVNELLSEEGIHS